VEFRQEAGDLYFARDEEDALYRIVQECLTNAVRHGQADHILLTIRQQENALLIDIRDNGKGAADMKEGFGLRHMRERLDLLSGSMTYGNRKEDPEDGQEGFYVIASLPVRQIKGGN
jgi:signal transduction histidine kinase